MGSDDAVGRIFVAVALTDEARHGLAAHLDSHLGDTPLPGRPVPPENWHLTLRFCGSLDRVMYEKLLAGLDQSELGDSFRIGFGGLGAFPRPARATVLWLSIERGAEELGVLATMAEDAAVDAGMMPEERPFHAHVTLSRIRPHQQVSPTIEAVPAAEIGMEVDAITVFRSHLGGGPARYEALDQIPLTS